MHKLFEICSITLFLCTFCAFLWLKRTVFTRLKTSMISVNPIILSNFSSCRSLSAVALAKADAFCAFLWLKNPRNPWFMNYLYAFGISTTVVSALQIHLFMQNEPNFQKPK